MEQQKLAEIEAVGPAMGLPKVTLATLKKWNTAYFQAYAEIDAQPSSTLEHATNQRRELSLLRRAYTKAWIGLLGEEQSRRFNQLANAFDSGQLEEALHPDPSVLPIPVISAKENIRPQPSGPSASKYEALFR